MIPASVRTGFLHLAEALAYRRDSEVAVRGIIASLGAGEKCNAEPELIRKGTSLRPSLSACTLFNKSIHSESKADKQSTISEHCYGYLI